MPGPYVDVKGGYYASPKPHPLTLARGLPVALGGGMGLAIKVSQQYRVLEKPAPRQPWQVSTVAYAYTLQEVNGPEILSYHWHPNVPNSVSFPHLHLGYGTAIQREELWGAHLPTGRVILEDFVRLLVEEFGVPPERADWEDALAQSRAEFEADRTR